MAPKKRDTEGPVVVRLPWPPTATSPNASRQGNWRKKTEAAAGYAAICTQECWAQKIRPMVCDFVDVEVTFYPPRNARFDLDNMLARAKQGLDSVALCIQVDDGNWRTLNLKRGPKVAHGLMVVTIHPVTSDQPEGTATIPMIGRIS